MKLLIDVVSEVLELKKEGKAYRCVCPFHESKSGNTAFYVYTDTNKYHCFACGAHGDAIDFRKRYYKESYPEAVKSLGGSLDPNFKSKPKLSQREILRDILIELHNVKQKPVDAGSAFDGNEKLFHQYKNDKNSAVQRQRKIAFPELYEEENRPPEITAEMVAKGLAHFKGLPDGYYENMRKTKGTC
jgi:hypothetical protein